MCEAKVAVGTASLGMNDTLGDALAVKVAEQLDQVDVLQQQRAVVAQALRSEVGAQSGSQPSHRHARSLTRKGVQRVRQTQSHTLPFGPKRPRPGLPSQDDALLSWLCGGEVALRDGLPRTLLPHDKSRRP